HLRALRGGGADCEKDARASLHVPGRLTLLGGRARVTGRLFGLVPARTAGGPDRSRPRPDPGHGREYAAGDRSAGRAESGPFFPGAKREAVSSGEGSAGRGGCDGPGPKKNAERGGLSVGSHRERED